MRFSKVNVLEGNEGNRGMEDRISFLKGVGMEGGIEDGLPEKVEDQLK